MCRLFVAVACLAVVYAGGIHSVEEAKAELSSAGLSDGAVTGIISIADKYKDQFAAAKSDREAGKAAFQQFHEEVATYMKTQSEADQTAYSAFVEKKKAQHGGRGGRHSTPSA